LGSVQKASFSLRLRHEEEAAEVGLGLIVAANYAPADLHERWNGNWDVGCNDAASDETGRLKRDVAQEADSAFADVLHPPRELDRHDLGSLHWRQTSGLDFQRVRKSDVLTSFSFNGSRHIVIMREPISAVKSSIGLVR
jgi:hypothetical protein